MIQVPLLYPFSQMKISKLISQEHATSKGQMLESKLSLWGSRVPAPNHDIVLPSKSVLQYYIFYFLINKSQLREWKESILKKTKDNSRYLTTISLQVSHFFNVKQNFMKFCQPVTTLTVKAQVNNGSLVSNQNMCCHVILSCITSHVFLRANILIKHGSMILRGAEFKGVPTIITPPH